MSRTGWLVIRYLFHTRLLSEPIMIVSSSWPIICSTMSKAGKLLRGEKISFLLRGHHRKKCSSSGIDVWSCHRYSTCRYLEAGLLRKAGRWKVLDAWTNVYIVLHKQYQQLPNIEAIIFSRIILSASSLIGNIQIDRKRSYKIIANMYSLE